MIIILFNIILMILIYRIKEDEEIKNSIVVRKEEIKLVLFINNKIFYLNYFIEFIDFY